VVCAVICEPVFPVIGQKQGDFSIKQRSDRAKLQNWPKCAGF
jgi:hypothetical protein